MLHNQPLNPRAGNDGTVKVGEPAQPRVLVVISHCSVCGRDFKTRASDGLPKVCPWGCDKEVYEWKQGYSNHLVRDPLALEGRRVA